MSTPVALADFFNLLKVSRSTPHLPGVREMARTAGGEVISAVLGSALWQGSVEIAAARHHNLGAVQALIEDIDNRSGAFLMYPTPFLGPREDPSGAGLVGATPRLFAVEAATGRVRIGGLPVGYQLRRGDFFAFSYASNPVRYALHRLLDDVVADSAGRTALTRVTPGVRPGYVAGASGAPVSLVKPAFKAMIVPGSIRWPSYLPRHAEGLGFDFIQTLR